MLTRIKIGQLFNVYDYDIDLTNPDGTTVKFMTAPNGFGKTTILDFIEAAMRQSYEVMFRVPFGMFKLFYDEKGSDAISEYSVTRVDEQTTADDTDVIQSLYKKLSIHLLRSSGGEESLIESFEVIQEADGTIRTNGIQDNTQLFFVARTCFYLTDDRLLRQKMDVVDKTLHISDSPLIGYPQRLKEILSSPEQSKEFEARINCFGSIINRCEFANKHLEIDRRFGFRFMADDELHSILSLDQLSSGEKQMIIQVFELLFNAQSDTLVMIDEPELSLHMMWQMCYLKNLSEIAELRGFQCIVATHSPQVFNSLWSKSIDLFTLSAQK